MKGYRKKIFQVSKSRKSLFHIFIIFTFIPDTTMADNALKKFKLVFLGEQSGTYGCMCVSMSVRVGV